ncbi:MAG: BrnT family toxin [Planctomycetota bacterium]|nr:MAG: BrnT family toxin [Planctomycetota bacterium]REK43467.1 MAG: BrnT family toxin [Planctomycetota bacterium]
MQFEWDSDKADANLRNHGVLFLEAMTVFQDPLAMTYDDPDHSFEEDRCITMGTSLAGRLLFISHTDREERIRIISTRQATRSERRSYEDG